MDEKQVSLFAIIAVSLIAVGGFYIHFNEIFTGNVALKIGGQKFAQSSGMAYSQPAMLCERLIGEGKIPKGFDYEAVYSEMVNRFGSNNCYDGTGEVGYWCCNQGVLGRY